MRQRGGRPASRAGLRSLLVVAVALSLAGCFGEDRLTKQQYERKVRSVYGEVQQAFRATGGASTKELPGRIGAAQEQLRKAADELDEAEPPEQVEEEHEEVVEGLREYADDLDEVRVAAERDDRAAIEAFNDRIAENEAIEQVAEAAEEMTFKGYDLGPIAEE